MEGSGGVQGPWMSEGEGEGGWGAEARTRCGDVDLFIVYHQCLKLPYSTIHTTSYSSLLA